MISKMDYETILDELYTINIWLEPDEKEVMDMAIKASEEIQDYRAIGTVEEFKALKEIDEDLRLKYCYEDLSSAENRGYMQGYNEATDEYMNALCEHCMQQTNECYKLECPFCTDGCDIVNIAEQLKGGNDDR